MGLRYQCEWVTEVAHKQNCQSRNVPMGPTANSKLFCACRWSVKSETLERLEKVVLATAIEEIGHDLSSKWQRHSTPTTDAKATYPWADHSHVSAEMQKVKNGCGFTWMDDGMLLDWGLVYVVDTYTFHNIYVYIYMGFCVSATWSQKNIEISSQVDLPIWWRPVAQPDTSSRSISSTVSTAALHRFKLRPGNISMATRIWSDTQNHDSKWWREVDNGDHMYFWANNVIQYPPTPADARGSALGNNTFDSCFGLQN